MGHIQDRWCRPARDKVTGKVILNGRGKPVLEKTELYGIGRRYKVRYLDPDNEERSKSFPDKQKKRADAGFTLRMYTHLVPSSHERARQAIDAVFGRATAAADAA